MSASFEVFCAVFARALFIAACAARSEPNAAAAAAAAALELVDTACDKSGWDAGPFELADKLGAGAMFTLLEQFEAMCQQQRRHIGNGLRVAARVMNVLRDQASTCKSFWVFSKNGTKTKASAGIGAVIQKAASELQLPQLPLASWSHHTIHLHILLAASEPCLSLLQRQAVPGPEMLDLLLVASGYPANQGGVLECARNTFALSDYESMVSSAGADALDNPSWRDTYDAAFERKIMTERPHVMPSGSVSKLSRRSPVSGVVG